MYICSIKTATNLEEDLESLHIRRAYINIGLERIPREASRDNDEVLYTCVYI